MKILVACEESQAVCIEMRKLGHESYSCDTEPCSGGHPEWHIKDDVLRYINGEQAVFWTMDNTGHITPKKWDMIIAFPPCTHLAVSGARHFEEKRRDGRQQAAVDFFMRFVNAECDLIAIENPVGIMSTKYRKPDQIIQPWQFGHPETKQTCLWLKGLPLLKETENVYEYMKTLPENEQHRIHWMGSNHSRERSKTFPGIAKAMAEQWAGKCDTDGN